LRSNTKGYGGKTHLTGSQNSDTTATSGREVYHLQFSLQAASPETFGYTLVFHVAVLDYPIILCIFDRAELEIWLLNLIFINNLTQSLLHLLQFIICCGQTRMCHEDVYVAAPELRHLKHFARMANVCIPSRGHSHFVMITHLVLITGHDD
jgi:hypothetical protein